MGQENDQIYATNVTPPMYVIPTYKNWPSQYQLTDWCYRGNSIEGIPSPLDRTLLNNPTDIIFPRGYQDGSYRSRTKSGMSADDYVYIVGVVDNENLQSVAVPIQSYSFTPLNDIIVNCNKITTDTPCNVQCEVASSCPSNIELNNSSFPRQSKVEQLGISVTIWQIGTLSAVLEGCDQPCSVNIYHNLWWSCFVGDTRILLSNNTFKQARHLTSDDVVMTWNFDQGKMEASQLLWFTCDHITPSYDKIITNTGRVFKNVGNHRLFSLTTNKFERCLEMIGHQVWTVDGPETIIDIETVEQTVDFCNAISSSNMNIITEGILSSCGFNNLYPIEDMRYVKQPRQYRPIDVYGEIPQSWYQSLRLSEHYCDPVDVKPYVDNNLLSTVL